PNIKVIISIREDYLGQLEEMYEDIPGILHHRLRLLPLSREQARQAILEPARVQDQAIKAAPLDFKPDALEMILDFLCKPKDRDSSRITHGVEPFQLQLLCRHLEEKARHKPDEKKGEIEKADLGGEPGMKKVLQNYYEDRLKELGPVWKRRRVRKLFTRGLITPSNRRLSLGVEDIENRFKIKKGLLDDLVNHRLLRSEPRLGSPYYELSHDSLIEPVRNSQKKSRTRNLWMTVGIGFLCVLFIIAYFSPFKKEEIYSISQTLSISQTKTHKAKIEIVEIGPEDAVTHYYKGFEQSLQGKYEEAIKSYEKATNLRKYYVEAYNNWGNVLYTQGKYNEAIEKFNTAIKIDPDYVDAYNGLGSISYKNKEYDEAIDYYEKAIDINKDYPYAYSNLGAVLIEIGNYKEAIENFKKAIEIKRDYLDAYNHWGDALTAQKKYNQAIEIFNQAIDIDPGYVYAYNGLGVASYEMKKYDDAMKYWKKAIRIDPGFAKAYYNMGLALKKRGKNEEAIEKFKKAIESDPDFLYAYYDLGMTLYEMGNYDEAINYFQKAIKIDPGFANAYYEIGIILLYHKKDYNKAIEKFNKVIELEPKAADAYLYKGYSLYHLKNYSESIESFKKAVEICPLPGYKTEYVEFSLLTGHVEEAFSLAKKYLKEKNIPQKNKLIMQFIAITSLLFQGKQPDAAECDELIKYYKSLPEKSHPEGPLIEWDFGEIKEFVNKATDNKLTIKQAERLSKLITILESSKKVPEKEEKKLKELCGIESNNISP
ncbi:MAG: tetratricopeptide repeat protein, partial [Candidatus Aminicenantes bacterium]